ncbi:MAG: hypothetical protein R2865_11030 [Deinococcales bacterium]
MRSILTTLGVVIGCGDRCVAAVVSLVAIGNGVTANVTAFAGQGYKP